MIMVIHFHLKNGIMVGKKRHIDVQFYIEVKYPKYDFCIYRTLGRWNYDRFGQDWKYAWSRWSLCRAAGAWTAPQAQNGLQKLYGQRLIISGSFFSNFCSVGNIARDFEFDTPFRDLGFHGVPHRSTCLLQPTSSAIGKFYTKFSFQSIFQSISLNGLHLLFRWMRLSLFTLSVFPSRWRILTWSAYTRTIPRRSLRLPRFRWRHWIKSRIGSTHRTFAIPRASSLWIGPKSSKLLPTIQWDFSSKVAGISWSRMMMKRWVFVIMTS